MLSVVLAAALAAQAVAAEPPGPPAPTPLQRQSGAPDGVVKPGQAGQGAQAPTPGSASAPPRPGPAPGQPAAGVISYPASFFTSAQPNTARDMLDRLPGFSFDSGDNVRGFGGAAGNVLIDGVRPSSKSDDLESIVRRVPAAQVERIELIRGGATGIDMQGKSVLANIIRRQVASTTGLVSVVNQTSAQDGRNAPGVRLEATHRKGERSIEGSLVVSDFLDDGAGKGPRVTRDAKGALITRAYDDSAAGGTQAVATGAYEQRLFGGKFRANAQLLGQRYHFDESVQDLGSLATPPDVEHDRQTKAQGELGLHYNRDFGPKLSIEALALQTAKHSEYIASFSTVGETDRFSSITSSRESILRGVGNYRFTPKLSLEVGAEGAYNRLDSQTGFAVNGAAVTLPAANVVVSEFRGEVFGTGTWRPSPKLTLEVGLRVEASHIASTGDVVLQKTLTFPKPRFSASWSPTADDQLRFRIEREVGQLNFGDFVASSSLSTGQILAGNPDLNPQQAWVIEGAYERRFWTDGAAVVTLRHAELTDVVDRVPIFSAAGAFDAPGNIGAGSKDELVVSLNVPLKRVGLKGGLLKFQNTWRRSAVKDPATGETRPISGLRPSEGTIDFSQDIPSKKIKFGFGVYLGWEEPFYRLTQIETDSFSVFGTLFAEWRPKPDLSIRLEGQDIGASYNRTLETYPGPRGRTSLATVERRELGFGPNAYIRVRKTF